MKRDFRVEVLCVKGEIGIKQKGGISWRREREKRKNKDYFLVESSIWID
jgi:hypothetical protein